MPCGVTGGHCIPHPFDYESNAQLLSYDEPRWSSLPQAPSAGFEPATYWFEASRSIRTKLRGLLLRAVLNTGFDYCSLGEIRETLQIVNRQLTFFGSLDLKVSTIPPEQLI